jgi:hypothetical protein
MEEAKKPGTLIALGALTTAVGSAYYTYRKVGAVQADLDEFKKVVLPVVPKFSDIASKREVEAVRVREETMILEDRARLDKIEKKLKKIEKEFKRVMQAIQALEDSGVLKLPKEKKGKKKKDEDSDESSASSSDEDEPKKRKNGKKQASVRLTQDEIRDLANGKK